MLKTVKLGIIAAFSTCAAFGQAAALNDGLMGWATKATAGAPTGGAGTGAVTCTATTMATLQDCMTQSKKTYKSVPFTLYLKGTFNGATNTDGSGYSQIKIERDNFSLIGLADASGNPATLQSTWLMVRGYNNIIVRNIRFIPGRDPNWAYEKYGDCQKEHPNDSNTQYYCPTNAEPDGMTLDGATRVWIDHNEFTDVVGGEGKNPNITYYRMYDALLDIKGGSDYVTLSYNSFNNHNKTSLIGAKDKADGDYHITYYRNLFKYLGQRSPRVRNGQVHLLNNLYQNVKRTDYSQEYFMSYAIGLGYNSKVYSERNAFDVSNATASDILGVSFDYWGQYFTDVGSWLNGSAVDLNAAAKTLINTRNADKTMKNYGKLPFIGPVTWSPASSYSYTPLTDVATVRSTVLNNAGVGKITP